MLPPDSNYMYCKKYKTITDTNTFLKPHYKNNKKGSTPIFFGLTCCLTKSLKYARSSSSSNTITQSLAELLELLQRLPFEAELSPPKELD
jgi:hypothetical protein